MLYENIIKKLIIQIGQEVKGNIETKLSLSEPIRNPEFSDQNIISKFATVNRRLAWTHAEDDDELKEAIKLAREVSGTFFTFQRE